MNRGHEQAEQVCMQLGLLHVFHYVRDTNPGNSLSYHNWTHICHMITNVFEGASYYKLPTPEKKNLVIAALFHDYGHSGGKLDDSENIEQATDQLYRFSLTQQTVGYDLASVERLIRVTEYPYVREPEDVSEKIIRDSDLMESGLDTWYDQIIHGLRREMIIKTGKDISEKEMLKKQLEFLKNSEWHTTWGQDFYAEKIVPNIIKMKDLLNKD